MTSKRQTKHNSVGQVVDSSSQPIESKQILSRVSMSQAVFSGWGWHGGIKLARVPRCASALGHFFPQLHVYISSPGKDLKTSYREETVMCLSLLYTAWEMGFNRHLMSMCARTNLLGSQSSRWWTIREGKLQGDNLWGISCLIICNAFFLKWYFSTHKLSLFIEQSHSQSNF